MFCFSIVDVFTPGTPGYQAPEMFKLKILHRKCDIFSFGILMWQLLVKEPNPYPESHPHTIIFLVVSEDSRYVKLITSFKGIFFVKLHELYKNYI